MSEKPLPFVITDRRKFTSDGQPRPDADPSPERHREPEPEAPAALPAGAEQVNQPAASESIARQERGEEQQDQAPQDLMETGEGTSPDLPPPPTAEQMEQSRIAFQATADRLDTAIRAANPGMDHPPAMSFEQLVQSVYMQAILQLGGGTQEGQQPQVDILGARQSIDMLDVLSAKTENNLSASEQTLLMSALFELRLAFLEITQALARSAQQRANPGGAGGPGGPGGAIGGRPGPSIVR